ncbi:hypothetical protein JYU34_011585 [Plutella xylostella]|uniref:Uncharacterized protein n=1 Tax=Plutella xylostella TaxID=51655 RepID=A0ABQ7QIK6_PLUXY|nr:hypothetical protein JYU34_011585 [Plutella xylostella]
MPKAYTSSIIGGIINVEHSQFQGSWLELRPNIRIWQLRDFYLEIPIPTLPLRRSAADATIYNITNNENRPRTSGYQMFHIGPKAQGSAV